MGSLPTDVILSGKASDDSMQYSQLFPVDICAHKLVEILDDLLEQFDISLRSKFGKVPQCILVHLMVDGAESYTSRRVRSKIVVSSEVC